MFDSWTNTTVALSSVERFFGCTDSGELLVKKFDRRLFSYDLESLNENNIGIPCASWLRYTTDLVESLVLLDQGSSKYED